MYYTRFTVSTACSLDAFMINLRAVVSFTITNKYLCTSVMYYCCRAFLFFLLMPLFSLLHRNGEKTLLITKARSAEQSVIWRYSLCLVLKCLWSDGSLHEVVFVAFTAVWCSFLISVEYFVTLCCTPFAFCVLYIDLKNILHCLLLMCLICCCFMLTYPIVN